MSLKKNIILVSTGIFQEYIKENINQLLNFDYNIYVIVDSDFFNKMEEYKSYIKLIDSATLHTDFDKKSKLDKTYRGGFWNNASKRLFLVYEFMKMNNIENVIHLENDVLLYSNMNYNFNKKIYITMDSKNRCIPGIIYIPKYDLFTKLIENYDFTKNDMINLANYYLNNKDIIKTFPIIDNSLDKCIYNENFKEFNSIFDGAAIGQYLAGVDPRNIAGDTTGFVNETCEIKYDKYAFKWMKKGGNYFPFVEINGKLIAINNLHIHCKKLENFRMKDPVENKYIKLLKTRKPTINQNKINKIIFISCGGKNAGDLYCSPHLFYNFNDYKVEYTNNWDSIYKSKNNIIIFGGGGIIDTNKDRSKYYKNLEKSNFYFHWGSGSNKLNLKEINWKPSPNEIDINDDILENFIFVGRRDHLKNYYDKHEYVPCVSCKIKLLQNNYKIKRKIGIIQHMWLKQIKNLNYPSISVNLGKYNINEIIKFIGESEIIITGSFHGAYWSLLMQKKVIINGNWSSKFNTLKYKPIILSSNIENDIKKCVIPPPEYLKECIELNDKFYHKIKNKITELTKKPLVTQHRKIEFITGEKIQNICDIFLGVEENFRYNPNVYKLKKKHIYIHQIDKYIDNKKYIFCYNTSRFSLDLMIQKLKYIKNPFILIFHNSDKNFNDKNLILFAKLPLLQRIYTQNMNVEHKKVFPLPIGLANSQWTHGNSKIHQQVFEMYVEKTKGIYFNFSKNTNKEKRNKCYNDIIKKGIKWNANLPYKEYLIELKKHKFAICPEGNGIDTHRFWECLYMNTIPICLKNKVTEYYKKYFPIIILNDWQELDVSKLSYSEVDYQYLDISWVIEQIGSEKIDHKYQALWKFNSIPNNIFDIVIPVGPNDKSVIEQQIKYTQKNIIGYRNIYLICYDPSITIHGCITIHENIFPFNIETVAKYHGKLERNGWYLQQLLKLYAGKCIPNILDKYLVIDSDTFFLKPTTFVENNKCLYNYGTEYHKPYFKHMFILHNNLTKVDMNKSGICHHMIFEKKYINELISNIEKNHNELFYNIFLQEVTDINGSGASEYEIYFNYMLKYNPDKIKIRKLHWKNTNTLETNNNYDYISYHWYMR